MISISETVNEKIKALTYRHRRRAFIIPVSLIDSGTSSADRFFKLHVESRLKTEVIGSSASG